ncbi:MAG: DUF4434 domain-containing protein [Candidatus Erginobacter occultus]|nr:DUF4434 domain-containing protein [Candidatus Erginobacter occultus]
MKTLFHIVCLSAALAGTLTPARAEEGSVSVRGTFIQLNRELAQRDGVWWDGLFSRIDAAGIDEVIVQYLADGIGEEAVDYLPVLEHIFPAAEAHGIELALGLEHDPGWWVEITAPEQVLRDYFLLRAARNLRLRKRLLDLYGDRLSWTGYYIPDEIDDLSWRDPERRGLLGDYLGLLASRLRENDPGRKISVSAFCRGRTEPGLFSRNLFELAGDSFDLLLVQDGQGGGDPEIPVLPLYYRALRDRFGETSRPRLAAVVEIFEETTAAGEEFSARPASPAAAAGRFLAAAPYFPEIWIFAFAAYTDPERGKEAAALYSFLRGEGNGE